MISLNYSLFIEIALFLAIVFFLQRFLFKPLLKLWDEREEMIDGNRKKAEQISKQLDQMIVYYEAQLWATRRLANDEREKIKRRAELEKEQMVQTSRNEAQEMLGDLREKIALEYREALKRIQEEAELMGKNIAEKILGRNLAG